MNNIPDDLPGSIMSSLLELIFVLGNATSRYKYLNNDVEDGTILNCNKDSTVSDSVSYAFGLYNIVCLFVFSMMVSRVSFKKDKCKGIPGLVIPMDMLNSHDYIVEYTLIFLSLSEQIYNFIFGMKAELGPTIPIIKFFIKVIFVIILSVTSYPFFAAICGRRLIWYAMVLISSAVFLVFSMFQTFEANMCFVDSKRIPLFVAAAVYCGIDLAMVCLFLWKLVNYVRRRGWSRKEFFKVENKNRDYSFLYVKELLKEKLPIKTIDAEESEESDSKIKALLKSFDCNEMRMKIKESVYQQIPGFSIPPRIIIGIFVGLYFSYRIIIDQILDLTPVGWRIISLLNGKLSTTNLDLRTSFELVSGNYSMNSEVRILNAFRHLIFFYANLFMYCIVFSLCIGFVNSIVQIFLLLRNYRLHFHKLTKKGFSSIIDIKHAPAPNSLVNGFVRYSGYQAAYTMWGIIVVTLFLVPLLFFIIGIFLLPLFFVENSWPRRLLINLGPVIIASFIFNLLQNLFVKYVLMKERGTLMEIDNRRCFMIYTHCAFFFNAMMGLFASIKRILIWLFTGVFTFSRIDFSSLPEYIHGFDSGYMCYIGFLYTEQYHFNPIMQCFGYLLVESLEKQAMDKCIVISKSESERKRLRYRNLWHLSLTLINNPTLLNERKLFLTKGKFFE